MVLKVVAAIIGALLMLAYMAPVVIRLNELALWAVVAIGAGMMLVDVWQSLRTDKS